MKMKLKLKCLFILMITFTCTQAIQAQQKLSFRQAPPLTTDIGQFVMWDYRDMVAGGPSLSQYHWWLINDWLGVEANRPERFVLYVTSPTDGEPDGEYADFYKASGTLNPSPTADTLNFVTFFNLVSGLNATASQGTNLIEIEVLIDGSSFSTAGHCTPPTDSCSGSFTPPALPNNDFQTMPCMMEWLSTLTTTLESNGDSAALGGLTIDPELASSGVKAAMELAVWIDYYVSFSTNRNIKSLRYAMTFGVSSKNTALYATARFPMTSQNWPNGLFAVAQGDVISAPIRNALSSDGTLCWRAPNDLSPILDTVYMQVYSGCSDIGSGNIWQWMNTADDPTTGNCGIMGTNYTPRSPTDAAVRLNRLLRGIPQTEGPGTVDLATTSNVTHVGVTFSADATVPSRGKQSTSVTMVPPSQFIAESAQLAVTVNGQQIPAPPECSVASGWKPQGGTWNTSTTGTGFPLPGGTQIQNAPYLVSEVPTLYQYPGVQDQEMSSRFVFLFSAEKADRENCYGNPFFGHWSYVNFASFADAFISESTTSPFFGNSVPDPNDGSVQCGNPISRKQVGIYDLRVACAQWGLGNYPGYTEGTPRGCPPNPAPGYKCCPYIIYVPPPFDYDDDGLVSGSDLSIFLSQWGACPKTETCWGDFNLDGFVNQEDLTLFLENWNDA